MRNRKSGLLEGASTPRRTEPSPLIAEVDAILASAQKIFAFARATGAARKSPLQIVDARDHGEPVLSGISCVDDIGAPAPGAGAEPQDGGSRAQ